MKKTMERFLTYGLIAALSAVSLTGCGEPKPAPSDTETPSDGEAVTKEDILSGVTDENSYLLKAMHAGFTENGETIFETIDGNKIVAGKYEPDNVYMLTMYTNGTEDKSDDTVEVVWGTCQPME